MASANISKTIGSSERSKKHAEHLIKYVNGVPCYVEPQRRWKNSRRSHNGYGRGLPKKRGAGGKGVWGLLGSELLEESCDDQNDPNYDREWNDRNIVLKEVIPKTTPEYFLKLMKSIILEYFQHGDTSEVALCLDEILSDNLKIYVTIFAIEIAMDHKDSQREMISILISDLCGRMITSKDITKGFDILLESLPNLILDTPEAADILGKFLARAVADDCIPLKYVTKPDDLDTFNEYAIAAMKKADTLLALKPGWVQLNNVWGHGGRLRPVKFITNQMTLLLQEYLSSWDIPEAIRCIRELEVPHFHHELIYEAILMILESLNQATEQSMYELFKAMDQAFIISPDMMEKGFLRVYDDMADIVLDIPLAYNILERFVGRCGRAGILTDKIIRNMPIRDRKRCLSEGDAAHIDPQKISPERD